MLFLEIILGDLWSQSTLLNSQIYSEEKEHPVLFCSKYCLLKTLEIHPPLFWHLKDFSILAVAAVGSSGNGALGMDIRISKMSLKTSGSAKASLNNFMGSGRSGEFTKGCLAGEYYMTDGSRRTSHVFTWNNLRLPDITVWGRRLESLQ